VKKNDMKDKLNKTSPFLMGSACEFFDKNPYFSNDQKPTYKKITKTKFKGTPFLPSSAINHVSNISSPFTYYAYLIFILQFCKHLNLVIMILLQKM